MDIGDAAVETIERYNRAAWSELENLTADFESPAALSALLGRGSSVVPKGGCVRGPFGGSSTPSEKLTTRISYRKSNGGGCAARLTHQIARGRFVVTATVPPPALARAAAGLDGGARARPRQSNGHEFVKHFEQVRLRAVEHYVRCSGKKSLTELELGLVEECPEVLERHIQSATLRDGADSAAAAAMQADKEDAEARIAALERAIAADAAAHAGQIPAGPDGHSPPARPSRNLVCRIRAAAAVAAATEVAAVLAVGVGGPPPPFDEKSRRSYAMFLEAFRWAEDREADPGMFEERVDDWAPAWDIWAHVFGEDANRLADTAAVRLAEAAAERLADAAAEQPADAAAPI